jgi:DNA (cytosine-5)-methyltransferase 1
MPELTPAQRAAGPHIATGVTLHKLYRKVDAGPPCDICQLPIVKPLAAAGILVHPTCGAEVEDMLESLQRKGHRHDQGKTRPMTPRIGGLCFGYGGLDLAVQSVIPGAELVWYSEIDKGANKVAAHRFPGVPNIGDMTAVDWTRVEPVDILTGGTPCQDLSHAGKRAGMTAGTRSNLWVAMREAVAVLRPSLVVWENVRGAYSAEADSDLESRPGLLDSVRRRHGEPVLRALARVLGDLSSLGYDCRWHGLRAADVGAPHGRFRVFVVAYPAADSERVRRGPGWDTAPGESVGGWSPTVAGGPDRVFEPALLPTPAVNDMGEGKTPDVWDEWTAKMQAAHGNGNGHGKSLAIEAQRLLPTPDASDANGGESWSSWRARQDGRADDKKGPPIAIAVQRPDWGLYADAITRWETLTRPAPPPTQPSKKGTPQLSPRFSEWMQGLPDGWVTDVPGITRNEALKAIGNGVCPQQAAAGLRIMLGTVASYV